VVGKEDCRSLGFARDDKGEGSVHLSSGYQGIDRAIADNLRPLCPSSVTAAEVSASLSFVIPSEAEGSAVLLLFSTGV
jgi:hypothetical protein